MHCYAAEKWVWSTLSLNICKSDHAKLQVVTTNLQVIYVAITGFTIILSFEVMR
jgi:hypothetical protein